MRINGVEIEDTFAENDPILVPFRHAKRIFGGNEVAIAAYKDQNLDLKLIGQQLNVENILEGSIRKEGNKIQTKEGKKGQWKGRKETRTLAGSLPAQFCKLGSRDRAS